MKILALDLSLSETGYYFIDDIKNEEVCGVVKTTKKNIDRLVDIRNQISKLIEILEPTNIVIEGYSFASRGRATFSLGELGGVIRVLVKDFKFIPMIVPPTVWKKYVVGKGNAKKELVLMKVYKFYNKEFENNNICDAFCLAKFGKDYLDYAAGDNTWNSDALELFQNYEKMVMKGE